MRQRHSILYAKNLEKDFSSYHLPIYQLCEICTRHNPVSHLLKYDMTPSMIQLNVNPFEDSVLKTLSDLKEHTPKVKNKITHINTSSFILEVMKVIEKITTPSQFAGINNDWQRFWNSYEERILEAMKSTGQIRIPEHKKYIEKIADKILYLEDDIIIYFLIHNLFFINQKGIIENIEAKVRDYTYNPNLSMHLFTYYVGNKIKKPVINKAQLKIGLDPELLFYKKNAKNQISYDKIVNASKIISSRDSHSSIGLDGCQTLLELRPPPDNNVLKVTNNLYSLLKKLNQQINTNNFEDTFGGMDINGSNLILESGGGFRYSIGGHVHVGHSFFAKYGNDKNLKKLTKLYDDFLYFPIKREMTGSLRQWSLTKDYLNEHGIENKYGTYTNAEKVHETIKLLPKSAKDALSCSGYEGQSLYRIKQHGLEYRSLPSFIINKEFTYLVLKLIKGLTEKYIDLYNNNVQKFSYILPPSLKDYRNFLSKEEALNFINYIYGDKKDIFLSDVFKEWNIQFKEELQIFFSKFYHPSIQSSIISGLKNTKFIQDLIGKKTFHITFLIEVGTGKNEFILDFIHKKGNAWGFQQFHRRYVKSVLNSKTNSLIISISRALNNFVSNNSFLWSHLIEDAIKFYYTPVNHNLTEGWITFETLPQFRKIAKSSLFNVPFYKVLEKDFKKFQSQELKKPKKQTVERELRALSEDMIINLTMPSSPAHVARASSSTRWPSMDNGTSDESEGGTR